MALPPSGGENGEDRYQPIAEINVTPMVDVMLVLLVIFMVTAPLLMVGVPLDLPKTRAAAITTPQGTDHPEPRPRRRHLHRRRQGGAGRPRSPPGGARGRGPGADRLCPRRPDDHLCAADGHAEPGQPGRVRQGIAGRRGRRVEVNRFGLPLALSLAAHAIVLALLLLLPAPKPPAEPPPAGGIEVAFAPSLPPPQPPAAAPPVKAEPPPQPPRPPPPPVKAEPPPRSPPPPPPLAIAPPPPAPEASVVVPEPLPPPPKPPVPPLRRPPVAGSARRARAAAARLRPALLDPRAGRGAGAPRRGRRWRRRGFPHPPGRRRSAPVTRR